MAEVCVDASYVLKLVLPEPDRDTVRLQWASWMRDQVSVVAPSLLFFEMHAVLRRKVARGEITDVEGVDAWRVLRRKGIQTVHPRGLFDRAWAIASELRRSTTYDAVYLATAALRECELWTADRRFANSAAATFSSLRSI